MRLRFALPMLVAACLSTFGRTHDADACGACLVPPSDNTVVTGHRMALSVSTKQTVLWDQIEYAGDPADFAWVLPVKPGAIVQASHDAWFDILDAATTTQIFQPQITCSNGGSGSGFGCGAYEDSAGRALFDGEGTGGGSGPAVTIVDRGTVGPYDTVTLSTDTPGALNKWLTDNKYALDPATQPIVDAYVAEGFDFIALKLSPNKGVQAMQPVRIVQPGADPTLPLRMVGIGTGANVALTLFVISEGRWEAKNFDNVTVPTNLVAWDFKDSSSNYAELRKKVLTQNNGATWLTAFALPGALTGRLIGLPGFMSGTRTYNSAKAMLTTDTIAGAYMAQGLGIAETLNMDCVQQFPNLTLNTQMVVNPCPLGKPYDDPSCGAVAGGEFDARNLICGSGETEPLDDVAVALTGLHPKDVWITRLEADLPRAALANDLVLQAASSQSNIDNLRTAGLAKNIEVVCGSGGAIVPPGTDIDAAGPRGRENLLVLFGMGLLSLAAIARRRFATV